MRGQLTVDRATLEKLHTHASSAARLVGHIDALATGPLADHVDTIAHELGELLGNPHLIAAPVPSARSTSAPDLVALDGVPELVAPDAPAASRMLMTDDRMRHKLADLPESPELLIAFPDDESTQPHVRQLGRHCQRAMRPRRPAHRRQHLRAERGFATVGAEQLDRAETTWVRSAIATALLALLGVISLLVLGACQVDTAAGATPTMFTVPATHTRAVFLHGASFAAVDEIATEGL